MANDDLYSKYESYKESDPSADQIYGKYTAVSPDTVSKLGSVKALKQGVVGDVGSSLASFFPEFVKSLKSLPGQAKSAGGFAKRHIPKDGEIDPAIAKNLGLTAAEAASAILSAPQVGARYIGRKYGDKEPGVIRRALERTPTPYELEQQVEKKFDLLPKEEGEAEFRNLGKFGVPAAAATAMGGGPLALASMFGMQAGGEGADPLHAALMSILPHVPRAIADYTPLSRGMAVRPLNQMRESAIEQGTRPIVPEETLQQSRAFLRPPNAPPEAQYPLIDNLINRARTGEMDAVFNLQSDVGRTAHELTRFPSWGRERLHGMDIRDFHQQQLLPHIQQALEEAGNPRAAELMQRGRNRYRRYHQQRWPRRAIYAYLGSEAANKIAPDNPLVKLLGKILFHQS